MSQANNIQWVKLQGDIPYAVDLCKGTLRSHMNLAISAAGCGQSVRLTSNKDGVQDFFRKAFSIQNIAQEAAIPTFFHASDFGEMPSREICESLGVPYEGKPALGFYQERSKDIIVLEKGEFNYGFVNAMMLGFMSSQYMNNHGFQYAHAACFEASGTGVLMIGDHKAGKSTLVSKILSEGADMGCPISLVSDDWVLLESKKNALMAHRLSSEYRMDAATALNPEIGLSSAFNNLVTKHMDSHDKASIPVEELCQTMGHISCLEGRVDIIVVLDPSAEHFVEKAEWNACPSRIARASTANVMPLDIVQDDNFNDFWSAALTQRQSIILNNRYNGKKVDEVARTVLSLCA